MKAIVFATKMGGGHMSAAQAVMHALAEKGCRGDVCDFLTLSGKRTSDIVGGAYVKLVQKSPNFFGKIYRAGQFISTPRLKSIVYFANTLYAGSLHEYILREKPDVLLTSHIFAAQALTHLKHLYDDIPPTIGIMTDYTCAPFWEETELEAYIIPHRALEGEFTAKHMPASKLHALGIPVDPDCHPPESIAEAKLRCQLNPDRPHIVIIGGSMGAGNLPDVLDAIDIPGIQITCVCGSNTQLCRKLREKYSGSGDIRIEGYVRPLFPLMDSADVILSKPGGLTSTEIMTKHIPFVIINPIKGVETHNAEFFEKLGAALYARSSSEISGCVRALLYDEAARKRMCDAQCLNFSSDVSAKIADFAFGCAKEIS